MYLGNHQALITGERQKVTDSDTALDMVRETRFLINRVDDWIFEEISPYLGQRVLEVGCGLGNLLSRLAGREKVVGLDTDFASVSRLKATYGSHAGMEVVQADIADESVLALRDYGFDTIVCLNVLEHIEHDEVALANMRALLKLNGHLLLVVPAHSWLYGSMDAAIGHYRRYETGGLQAKLASAGFQLTASKYLNTFGALGWWFNGRVLRRPVPPSDQLRLFNHVVPAVRAIEGWINPRLGISLLVVAQ